MQTNARHFNTTRDRSQRGSALFTAMMLLIILSLLGISAAVVTGLQERMASTYRSDHVAFENAEARLRATERRLLAEIDPCHAANPDPTSQWMDSPPVAGAESYRNLAAGPASRAFGWRGSNKAGQPAMVGDVRCAYFEVNATDFDVSGGDATSQSVVASVFVP